MLSGEETADEGIPAERLRKMGKIRLWSLSQLTDEDRAFIAGFQPTVTVHLENDLRLLCFHGSLTSFDGVILPAAPQEEFQKFLGADADQILTGGHTCPTDSPEWQICLPQIGKRWLSLQSQPA